MRYMSLLEASIVPGRSQAFINAVQQWERGAFEHPDGPVHHAVLIDPDEPTKVVLLAEFRDEDHLDRYEASGLDDELRAAIGACCDADVRRGRLGIFYAAGTEGPRAIYGEEPTAD